MNDGGNDPIRSLGAPVFDVRFAAPEARPAAGAVRFGGQAHVAAVGSSWSQP